MGKSGDLPHSSPRLLPPIGLREPKMRTRLRVLLVEDSESDAALIVRHLNMADYDVAWERIESAGQMRTALEAPGWDIVIADYKLPGFDAPTALAILQQTALDLPFVVVSGQIGEESAVALMKAGAYDYLMKDQLARLAPVVERELGEARMRRERRRGAEQLRLSVEELARSNAELEQFAYVVSHDLQEPLRMVASYVQLLEERYTDQLDGDAHEFIAYAVDGAARMKQMIADLLAYSRVGKNGKAMVAVACEAALGQACADLRASITEAAAEIIHGPLPTVLGDAAQFTHLFQNLIGNAIKFRSAGAAAGARFRRTERPGMGLLGARQRHRSGPAVRRPHLHGVSAPPRAARTTPAPGSGWRSPGKSWNTAAAESGWNRNLARARPFDSPSPYATLTRRPDRGRLPRQIRPQPQKPPHPQPARLPDIAQQPPLLAQLLHQFADRVQTQSERRAAGHDRKRARTRVDHAEVPVSGRLEPDIRKSGRQQPGPQIGLWRTRAAPAWNPALRETPVDRKPGSVHPRHGSPAPSCR